MIFKNLFQELFVPSSALTTPPTEFPKDGILWHEWNDETKKLIAERERPFLLLVANPDPTVSPFLKAVLRSMPSNGKLRELLHDHYIAVMVQADSIPDIFRMLGAGSGYDIAVLSPAGYTPMLTLDPTEGKPEEIAATLVKVLEKLREVY